MSRCTPMVSWLLGLSPVSIPRGMSTLGIAVVWVLIMLSLSCDASKLAAVVIALSILSPPPYGQLYLLQGLELEMGLVAQCELQFEVHEKLVEVLQLEVVLI
ncbi:hypothetical protein Tco_1137205 [Tanacetum coccineum]